MPWCDTCDRFYNPNSLRADGTCSTCGRPVAEPAGSVPAVEAQRAHEPATGAPWHFKLLVAATVLYLGYRLFQGVVWVAERL